ncbi:MAG: hypothetical protein KA479_11650 [Saprospiraceae bacterium]|nr:hypothetical protein [Saprospiraceae bacterium]
MNMNVPIYTRLFSFSHGKGKKVYTGFAAYPNGAAGRKQMYTIKGILRSLFLLFGLMPFFLYGQCPLINAGETVWTGESLDQELQEKLIYAVREGFNRYCQVSDLQNPDSGVFSDEKGREFQQLFNSGARIYNDLQPDKVEHIPAEKYRDLVLEHFFHTGVEFQLQHVDIKEIVQQDEMYKVVLHFDKSMLSYLDKKMRYREYKAGGVVYPLIMEVNLWPKSGEEGFVFKIYGIKYAHTETKLKVAKKYSEISLGGMMGLGDSYTLASPWENSDGAALSNKHFMFNVEAGHWRSLFRSDRFFGGFGIGFRQGFLTSKINSDFIGVTSDPEEGLIINGRKYNAPYYEQISLFNGSQVDYTYSTVFVPLGLRYVVSSNFANEFVLDLNVLGGISFVKEKVDGSMAMYRSYHDPEIPDCLSAPLLLGEGKGISAAWKEPFVHLRFSTGWFRTISGWSDTNRTIGFSLRLDLEYGILPMLNRAADTAWYDSSAMPGGGQFTVNNSSTNVLISQAQVLSGGLRAGLFWKW